jgi:hypothetical protein
MPVQPEKPTLTRPHFLILAASVLGLSAAGLFYRSNLFRRDSGTVSRNGYQSHKTIETSGYYLMMKNLLPWSETASLAEIYESFRASEPRLNQRIDSILSQTDTLNKAYINAVLARAAMYGYAGDPQLAYDLLTRERERITGNNALAREWLYTFIYFQGITGLRRGENENCVMCLGKGACILPIAPSAFHTKREGSETAVRHFTEYLKEFPDEEEVRWLLNIAHMTLGEYPDRVDPKYLIRLDPFLKTTVDIGKFNDIAHQVGVDRLNSAGGAIMEDFDNDGFLDIVVSSLDATEPMAYFHNKGDGTFEDRTAAAGLTGQFGGLNCVQTDYNNDGHIDIFVPRGAWVMRPMRPSLLRNNGDGTFTDVTEQAGLHDGVTSGSATWADYDNDGFLDLFICCEAQPNKLYHNNGDGTFTEVAEKAGVAGKGGKYKGATWIDYNNDDYPDLFVTDLNGRAALYRNNHDGSFTDVSGEMGIDGPEKGFSCWAWDFDNDGWLDIFATSYDHTIADVVNGLVGKPHSSASNRLFRNMGGKGFQDVTQEVGLDRVFATMGSNFGDFDNDGFLDMYLGTGDPNFSTLIPNRMFKNIDGKRFVENTVSSGTGNLQKGHGVACGDWDNDGNVDIFIDMGGAVPGDKFHNSLYQNPGHGNHWLTVKLVGQKTNRAAIGARIKVMTDAPTPLIVHRHISSGSSFGANPLQQTIGIGKAERVVSLEIRWPTSKTTQVFQNLAANQTIEITEFATEYRKLERKRISLRV